MWPAPCYGRARADWVSLKILDSCSVLAFLLSQYLEQGTGERRSLGQANGLLLFPYTGNGSSNSNQLESRNCLGSGKRAVRDWPLGPREACLALLLSASAHPHLLCSSKTVSASLSPSRRRCLPPAAIPCTPTVCWDYSPPRGSSN